MSTPLSPQQTPSSTNWNNRLEIQVTERIDRLLKKENSEYESVLSEERNGPLYKQLIHADTAWKMVKFRRMYNPHASVQKPWNATESVTMRDLVILDPREEYTKKQEALLAQISEETLFRTTLDSVTQCIQRFKEEVDIKRKDQYLNEAKVKIKSLPWVNLFSLGNKLAGLCEELENELDFLESSLSVETNIKGSIANREEYYSDPASLFYWEETGDDLDEILNENDFDIKNYKLTEKQEAYYRDLIVNERLSNIDASMDSLQKLIHWDTCLSALFDRARLIEFMKDTFQCSEAEINYFSQKLEFLKENKGILFWTKWFIFDDLRGLKRDWDNSEQKKYSDKIRRAKSLTYSMALSPKDVEDVRFWKDAGCCILPEKGTNGYSIPHFIADNGTLIFNIKQQINNNDSVRRVGIVLAFEVQEWRERVLLCNSVELSSMMNPSSVCRNIITYVEQQLREFGKTQWYDRVEMSSHEHNTSWNYAEQRKKRKIKVKKVWHVRGHHIFYADMKEFGENSDGDIECSCYQIYPESQ